MGEISILDVALGCGGFTPANINGVSVGDIVEISGQVELSADNSIDAEEVELED